MSIGEPMKFLSLCSGIEAASVAWHPLGWEPVGFSEIEKFPNAVLNYRYPSVPNFGDMTKFKEWKNDLAFDLLVGGTPCQSFSVAGLRKGLDDARGNLALTYCAIAEKYKPRWLVWENVPGILLSNKGKDFASFVTALGEIGYHLAYRILDAQYFGVPQRRKRVFVVAYLGDWRPPTAVLFEPNCSSGNTKTSRKARKSSATDSQESIGENGKQNINYFYGGTSQECSNTVTNKWHKGSGGPAGSECSLFVCQRNVNSEIYAFQPGKAKRLGLADNHEENLSPTIRAHMGDNQLAIATENPMLVRRLTPIECERLQGFPDNYTQIPYGKKDAENCPDSPRYKALGNSMAVPVMAWIGKRIALWESLN